MPTLKTILLGNLSVELKYEVDPADDSIIWGDGAFDHFGIVEASLMPRREIRFPIEIESLSADEMDRIRIDAWFDYNNHPSTP